ncbi:Sporulation kinase A [Allorhodopirellula solitaria]|uniref:histidine kinase n=2 Tax=Allorhodopirellula solitaria TaxID=2527987 RepID=A0A5C5XYJ6_9BACT|nr:ATP-binding protein [Allorhodopirellula solitaria]TWT67363.1 Sporulation kinase A [Allorhodopirellula solitaria]
MKSASKSTPQRGDPIPERFFRMIGEFTFDWESWFSCDGEVLWVNQAVERFTGYTPRECVAMADYPLKLIAPEDRDRMARCFEEGRTGSTANNVEFRALHRDQSQCWCAVSWQPMMDATGRSLGFRASVRDVSEKRQLREQLRLHNEHLEQLVQERTAQIAKLEKHRLQVEKLAALGELAAGVAHEINNPLAGIRNAFALLKRHLPQDVKHYDKLELIDGEIERISGITHQMYQLYRPSQQNVAPFSVRQAVAEVIALTLPLSRKTNVEVVSEFQALQPSGSLGDDEVILRSGEVKQVLLNLVRNAIQASQPGQQVTIIVSTDRDGVTITVADQGHGIAASVISKVFDPFFSTKTEAIGQGMGLGLSVSHGIVEAMEGTINATSTPGEDTKFTVRLPRRLQSLEKGG